MVLVLLLFASTAHAGNDDGVLIGDDAALMGGAVTAIANNGAALWYNPAGIVGAEQNTLDVSGTAYNIRIHQTPRLLFSADGASADGTTTEFAIVPAAVTYVRALNARTRFGFGVFQPNASDYEIRSDLITGGPIPSEWVLDVTERFSETHIALGVGHRVNDRFFFGVTLTGFYVSIRRAGQFAGVAIGDSTTFAAFSGVRAASGLGASLGAGVQMMLHPKFRVGITLSSPSMLIQSSTRVEDVLSSSTGEPSGEVIRETSSELGFTALFPARARIGLAYTDNHMTLSVDGDYQHRLTNQRASLRRQAVYNFRAGARFRVAQNLDFGFGLFTDRANLREVTDFLDRRLNFYGGTVGVSFEKIRRLDTDAESVPRMFFGTTLALRYAYGHGRVGGLQVDADFDNNGVAEHVAVRQTAHELGVNVAARLRF